jgi:hypothetical protein
MIFLLMFLSQSCYVKRALQFLLKLNEPDPLHEFGMDKNRCILVVLQTQCAGCEPEKMPDLPAIIAMQSS